MKAMCVNGRGIAGNKRDIYKKIHKNQLLQSHPYEGTLNFILEEPIIFDKRIGYFDPKTRGYFWAASVNGEPCVIHRWRRCPLNVIEIIFLDYQYFPRNKPLNIFLDTELVTTGFIRKNLCKLLWGWNNYYNSRTYIKLSKIFHPLFKYTYQDKPLGLLK